MLEGWTTPTLVFIENQWRIYSDSAIADEIAEKLEGVMSLTPTKFDKNSLPDDVKLSFHKGVELYQCIQNYELGVFTKDEFIKEMRSIEAK
jgi:hypothetical protein